jgi:hypothetical protein
MKAHVWAPRSRLNCVTAPSVQFFAISALPCEPGVIHPSKRSRHAHMMLTDLKRNAPERTFTPLCKRTNGVHVQDAHTCICARLLLPSTPIRCAIALDRHQNERQQPQPTSKSGCAKMTSSKDAQIPRHTCLIKVLIAHFPHTQCWCVAQRVGTSTRQGVWARWWRWHC